MGISRSSLRPSSRMKDHKRARKADVFKHVLDSELQGTFCLYHCTGKILGIASS